MSNKYRSYIIFIILLGSISPAAYAHLLSDQGHTWFIGFLHPLLGIDHLLAMLAVGLWAAQQGSNRLWQLPVAFLGMMILGSTAGTTWLLPSVETGILSSLLVLGLMLMLAIRLPAMLDLLIVGFFALFHGYAHAAEMPQRLPVASYSGGFLFATTILLAMGVVSGLWLRNRHYYAMLRIGGLAIGITGGWLCF